MAQISIVRTDIGTIGSKSYLAIRDTFTQNINVGTADTGKVWNFATATPTEYDSIEFFSTAGYPDAPGDANIVAVQGGSESYFMINDTVWYDIQTNPATQELVYVLRMRFPLTRGMGYSDTTDVELATTPADLGFPLPVDSVKISARVITTANAESSGTLITPKDSYQTLGVRYTQNVSGIVSVKTLPTDTVWTPFLPINQQEYSYSWFAKNGNFAIAEATLTPAGRVRTLTWQVDSIAPILSTKRVALQNNLMIYPNPANTVLNIELSDASVFQYQITDITGKVVAEGNALRKLAYNTAELNNGMYLCVIRTNGEVATKRFVVQH
jgi:hypothetical protein